MLLNSGQSYTIENKKKYPDNKYRKFSFEEREDYISELEKKIYDHEKLIFRDSVPINRMLEIARSRLWTHQKRRDLFPNYRLYINILDRDLCYEIDFQNEYLKNMVGERNFETPYLKLNVTNTFRAYA